MSWVLDKKAHYCDKPTLWWARANSKDKGSIWQCESCQKYYELSYYYGEWYWKNISARKAKRKMKKWNR